MPSKLSNTKTQTKRHKKAVDKRANGLSKPAFRRVARTAGVTRMPGNMYEAGKIVVDQFNRIVLEAAVTFAANDKRKTIQAKDIRNALSMRGRDVYGSVRVTKRAAKKAQKDQEAQE